MDEQTLKLMKALAPQANRKGVNEIMMSLFSQALQPKTDPTEQLRELYAQSKINEGDWQGAQQALTADQAILQQLFSQSGGQGGAANEAFQARVAEETDPTRLTQYAELTPAQQKQFLGFKPKSRYEQIRTDPSRKDSTFAYTKDPGDILPGMGRDFLDYVFNNKGRKSKSEQEDEFLKNLL